MKTEIIKTLDGLAEAANNAHLLAVESAATALEHALRAGEALNAAKTQIPHGQWLGWLARKCTFSERTAQIYLRTYERRDALPKAQRAAHLSLRVATAMIADPKSGKEKLWKNLNAAIRLLEAIRKEQIEKPFDINSPGASSEQDYLLSRATELVEHVFDFGAWEVEVTTAGEWLAVVRAGEKVCFLLEKIHLMNMAALGQLLLALKQNAVEPLAAIATPGESTACQSSELPAMPQTAFNAAAPPAKRGENTLSRNSGEPTAFNVANIEPG